jgi:ribosome biogenesis GTPase
LGTRCRPAHTGRASDRTVTTLTSDTPSRARVVAVHKNRWELAPEPGRDRIPAVLAGRFRHGATGPADLPVVGDWVSVAWNEMDQVAMITDVEPRSGLLARKRPGETEHDAVVEQAIAANIDMGLVAMAVTEDFSVRRLERFLTLVWDSGATPVVVLTKADLVDRTVVETLLSDVEDVAFGVRPVVTSSRTGEGVTELRSQLAPDTCAILLGSSGVGKSSLLNALAGGALQAVTPVRDFDGKGRHTTTARRLVELPWGAYLVDTPGLRELQLWGDEESLTSSFPDVELLAEDCRFSDCTHLSEPGCAVMEAVDDGILGAERLASWHRLRRELAHLATKRGGAAARAQRQRWKAIAKAQKQLNRERGGR